MTSYHCRAKAGKRGRAEKNIQYILRCGPYRARAIANGVRARFADLMASGFDNLPQWAESDPVVFFAASDARERQNGTSFRAIHFSLPRGDLAMQVAIVERVCQRLFHGSRRHAYVWAIHNPKAAFEGNDQPHAHVTFCERLIDDRELDVTRYFSRFDRKDPSRGGYLKFGWEQTPAQRRDHLIWIRATIAEEINIALEECGRSDRVSHLSHAERGFQREAERHYRRSGRDIAAAVMATRRLRERIGVLDESILDDQRLLIARPSIRHLARIRRDRQKFNALAVWESQTSADQFRRRAGSLVERVIVEDQSQDQRAMNGRSTLDLEQMFGMLRPNRAERIRVVDTGSVERDDIEPGERED